MQPLSITVYNYTTVIKRAEQNRVSNKSTILSLKTRSILQNLTRQQHETLNTGLKHRNGRWKWARTQWNGYCIDMQLDGAELLASNSQWTMYWAKLDEQANAKEKEVHYTFFLLLLMVNKQKEGWITNLSESKPYSGELKDIEQENGRGWSEDRERERVMKAIWCRYFVPKEWDRIGLPERV